MAVKYSALFMEEGNLVSIRIILADDHRLVREGIRSLIELQPGMEVIAEASDGRVAVQLSLELSPDIVLMDISMPNCNGVEATRRIVAENHCIKVIALSMHSDGRLVAEMLKAGASGYLLKDCSFDELLRAINAAITGQVYLSPGIAGIVVKDYVKSLQSIGDTGHSTLTPREREVLQLLAEGKTTNQIASDLHLSVKTVETHRRQIMNKLNLYSIAELTKYAIREGITSV